MRDEILSRLQELEHQEDVLVCLAVESGSRAWGFPSVDSDYDVRFIYIRRPQWYLSIDLAHKRDVIEQPVDDLIDLSGWDLRKALQLFMKSNPPLFEWLQCEQKYVERSLVAQQLRTLLPEFYSPRASFHHYKHMADGAAGGLLAGQGLSLKECFYALRALLALRWIRSGHGPVPIEFDRLLEHTANDASLRADICALRDAKSSSQEGDSQPLRSSISRFMTDELAAHDGRDLGGAEAPDVERLNRLFREALTRTWQDAV